MSNETVYYPKSTDPTELTGLYSRGQMLSHVEESMAAMDKEMQSKYRNERASTVKQRTDYNHKASVKKLKERS